MRPARWELLSLPCRCPRPPVCPRAGL
jgi:hypothetical protein